MKEFTVSENQAFRLRVKSSKCLRPEDLNSLEFIQESLNDKGEVNESSTYNFFLTNDEVQKLSQGLREF